jgi:hypothetical protein
MLSTPLPITPNSSEQSTVTPHAPRHGVGVTWIWKILYILYCLEVGVFLIFLPWLSIWDNNYLVYRYPSMQQILANPFFKGGVLGLGIVNVLIGISEIAQLRKSPKGMFSR